MGNSNFIYRAFPGHGFELCAVKTGVNYDGTDSYNQANVGSLADCMDICREKDIKYFVWVETEIRCVCKAVVTDYERQNECCSSGQAAGPACASKAH